MKKIGSVIVLILPLIFISLVGTINAQSYLVGVVKGDTFVYNAIGFGVNGFYNDTEYYKFTVTNVTGTHISLTCFVHGKNGTEGSVLVTERLEWGNYQEGWGFPLIIFPANLVPGSDFNVSGETRKVNETLFKTFGQSERAINHYQTYYDIYFDKQTGILTEYNDTNSYYGMVWKLNSTTAFTTIPTITQSPSIEPSPSIPEFPTFIVLPILMATVLAGLIIYKKKLGKTEK